MGCQKIHFPVSLALEHEFCKFWVYSQTCLKKCRKNPREILGFVAEMRHFEQNKAIFALNIPIYRDIWHKIAGKELIWS